MGVIRFMLALSVAIGHIPEPPFRLLNAAVAVLGFFTVSGFYMAMVLTEKYQEDVRAFYVARLMRLYPAYFAMATIMVAWFWFTSSPNAFTSMLPMPAGEQTLIALVNLLVIGQDLYELMNHIAGAAVRPLFSEKFFNPQWMLVGQAWSLSSEAFFYLLAPFVVRSPIRIIALLLVSLAIRFWLLQVNGFDWVWGYWFFPASAAFFLLGSLAYHAHEAAPAVVKAWSKHIGAVALALIAIWFAYTAIRRGIVLPTVPKASLDKTYLWVTYITFALAVPFLFAATKDIEWDRRIGDLSYPLYLVHGLVQGIFYIKYELPRGQVSYMLLALSASVVAAIAMLLLVERPVERWRQRVQSRALSPVKIKPAPE